MNYAFKMMSVVLALSFFIQTKVVLGKTILIGKFESWAAYKVNNETCFVISDPKGKFSSKIDYLFITHSKKAMNEISLKFSSSLTQSDITSKINNKRYNFFKVQDRAWLESAYADQSFLLDILDAEYIYFNFGKSNDDLTFKYSSKGLKEALKRLDKNCPFKQNNKIANVLNKNLETQNNTFTSLNTKKSQTMSPGKVEQEKQKRIALQKKAEEEERKRKELERKLAVLEKLQKEQQQSKPKTVIAKKPQSEFPLKPIPINFPSVSVKRDDIAVIIGNANYKKQGKDIPNVNPAYADAEGIKQYFMKAKGVREGNIIYLKDATNAQLLSVFGNEKSHKGKLFNYIKPNKSNVYIYYAGHGAPGKEGDAYLVPTDTDSQTIEFTGYPLSTLYSNLGKLPAKSMTVILEACFSGGSQSGSLISRASPIVIQPKKTMIPATVKVIAAGSERQMVSWEEDSSHSLFTKYFLKAMSGEGDANKDGNVSDAELKEYLSDTMTYYARRYYGRDQKVQIHNGG